LGVEGGGNPWRCPRADQPLSTGGIRVISTPLVVLAAIDEMQGFLRVVVTTFQTAIAWWLVSAAWGGGGAGNLHHVDDDPPRAERSSAVCRQLPTLLVEFAFAMMLVATIFNHGNAARFTYFQFSFNHTPAGDLSLNVWDQR
jgi:hypothetical protein